MHIYIFFRVLYNVHLALDYMYKFIVSSYYAVFTVNGRKYNRKNRDIPYPVKYVYGYFVNH